MEGEELVNSLRQLVISFEPTLRKYSHSYKQAKDALLLLEEHDENFHRYQFVRQLKAKIEECIGETVDEEIEKYSSPLDGADDQKTLVQTVTDRILNSKEFIDLTEEVKNNVTEAVNTLMANFADEFGSATYNREYEDNLRIREDIEMGSSLTDSMYQGSLMFMNQEQAFKLAEDLDPRNVLEERQKALHSLSSIPPVDAVTSDHWPELRKGVLAALTDSDPHLAKQSLKFVARGFSSTASQNRELYILLVDYLSQLCKDNIRNFKTGIDLKKPEHIRIITAMRLLNEFQLNAPSYWVRCPETLVEQVLDSTLKLFTIQYASPISGSTGTPITTLHLIAVLDPHALWFNKWMHGNYSRAPLLVKLGEQKKIVENAVRQCIEFATSRKIPYDLMSDFSDTFSRESLGEGRRMHYTRQEIDYLFFIHSLSIVGKLLCHEKGRSFFPMKIKDREEPVSITNLLVCLIQLIGEPTYGLVASKLSGSHDYDPAVLVTAMLKSLAVYTDVCQTCLCRDAVTDALLAPVSRWLDDEPGHVCPKSTYLHIADVLADLASSSVGRQHLLYGEGQERFTRTKSSAAHVIADFAKKAINYDLPADNAPPPSNLVTGGFIYVCRQLYNTCEGLLAMNMYELHSTLSEALNEASREAELSKTPTPSEAGSDSSYDPQASEQWVDTLRDNLLNFAGTPKGVLLLQQTNMMEDCVAYMFERYINKQQVSKCEKFGYGTMVSQLATTAAGLVALRSSGFIRNFVNEIWTVLECGLSDAPAFSGKIWPVDPVDKVAHKPLLSLLNTLMSYPAVYEVLYEQQLPNKDSYSFREIPNTVVELLDRITFVDTDAKIHSLFNYEQSHMFGLRLLSVLMSSLDTFLLLQSQYKVQEMLLACQEASTLDDREIVVDMLTVERNYILVKSHLVGGPSERVVPPRAIAAANPCGGFRYPLFSGFPIPREYAPNVAGRSAMKQDETVDISVLKQENELSRFLTESKHKLLDPEWLPNCRDIFCVMLTSKPEQAKGNVLQDLLERVLESLSDDDSMFPLITYSGTDSALRSFSLTYLQQIGVKLAVRYGMHLKLLNSSSEAHDNLTQLLKQCGYFLQQQQRKGYSNNLRYLRSHSYPGFDWFASTIFLLMNGNLDRSWKFLYQFSTLVASSYLWLPRLHRSVHLPPTLMSSGVPPIFSSTGHNIDLILQAELPLVYSAFRMSGFNAASICQHWLSQCFWNYLDWLDIVHYICLCVLMGIDYQVYLCVAIMRYLRQDILRHLQEQDLVIFLKEEPLKGFRIGDHLNFMKDLEDKFRKTIMLDMQNISKP